MAAWDRLPTETDKAFDAFAAYYILPARERSIQAAYRASSPRKDSIGRRASGQWSQWAVAYDWVARAAAYDTHLAEQDRLLWEERRRRMREREWARGDALHDLVEQALPSASQFIHSQRQLIPGRDGAPDREVITLSFDVTGLSRVSLDASKLQRLATDEPTDNINNLSGATLDAYITAQLARLADGGKASNGGAPDDDDDTAQDSGV